jgi:hypothetical protein
MSVRNWLVLLCIACAFSVIVRFSLQFVPAFTIREIRVTEQKGREIPASVMDTLRQWYGKNGYAFTHAEMVRALRRDPIVESVSVKRRFSGVLDVTLRLVDARAIILCMDGDTVTDSSVVASDALIPLRSDEREVYPEDVIRVEVSDSYGRMLRRYGMDDEFRSVLGMVGSLSGNTSLITAVKYDNNSSNSFGKVVLVLEPLNVLVSIREKIDPSRLSQALDVVKEQQKGVMPGKYPIRYDVYDSGLVRR